MADVIKAGQDFLAGVLATLTPEAQAKAKEVFDSAEAAAAVKAIGEGVLRQDDYSRNIAATQTEKQKAEALYKSNTEWYAAKQQELQELDALRAKVAELEAGTGTGTGTGTGARPDKPTTPPDLISRADLDKILSDTERGAVGFIAESNVLALQHYKEFGEILDITSLLTDKRVQQIGLKGVYQDKFKPQYDAKAKAADDARIEAIRKEERLKVQQELANSHSPYPIRGNEPPSTLDALEAARAGKAPALKDINDMAAEYARLEAVRAGVQ